MKKIWLGLAAMIMLIVIGKHTQGYMREKVEVISAIGIDPAESGYKVTLQIINPAANKKEGSGEMPTYVFTKSGDTVLHAIRKLQTQLVYPLLIDYVDVVMISEKFAREEGIEKLINVLIRDPAAIAKINVVIVKEQSAEDALRVFTPVIKVPSNRIVKILESTEKREGIVFLLGPNEIKRKMLFFNNEVNVPYIKVVGNIEHGTQKENIEEFRPKTYVKAGGFAYFTNGKLAGFLTEKESRVYTLLQDKLTNAAITLSCPNQKKGKITLHMASALSKKHVTLKDGKPHIDVSIKAKGVIEDEECQIDYSDPKNTIKAEQALESYMKRQINNLIQKSKESQIDILEFGQDVYNQHPREWKNIKKQWKDLYPDTTIEVKVKAYIQDTGDVMTLPN